jgi:hypothetical protein
MLNQMEVLILLMRTHPLFFVTLDNMVVVISKTINVPAVSKMDLSSAILMAVILVLVSCVLVIVLQMIAYRMDYLMMVLKTVNLDALVLVINNVASEMLDYAVEHKSISRAHTR